MNRYSPKIITKIRQLRAQGKTYGEIQTAIQLHIPKSSLSFICQHVLLPQEYESRIAHLQTVSLGKGRRIALEINRIKQEKFLQILEERNVPIAKTIHSVEVGKVALAMLCLGEASKYNPQKTRSFSLGNSDPRILILFLGLLQECFPFDVEKVRATVQCRADQDPVLLKQYWQKVTGIPARLFYKPQVDPRTKGKPTKKKGYRGVLRIDYFDSKIHRELECLAELVYNEVHSRGPVAQR